MAAFPVGSDVRAEEREARRRFRSLQKAQRAAARARDRDWHRRLRDALRAHPRADCRCELRASMSRSDLRELGAGCTEPAFVCPRVDAVRRVLGV